MKKILTLLACSLIVISAIGCGAKDEGDTSATGAGTSTDTAVTPPTSSGTSNETK